MIWTYLLLFIATLITNLLQALHLQKVVVIPQILGIDIDGLLVAAVSMARSVFNVFWPLQFMFDGAIFILGYLILKNIVLRMFLGGRAPGA